MNIISFSINNYKNYIDFGNYSGKYIYDIFTDLTYISNIYEMKEIRNKYFIYDNIKIVGECELYYNKPILYDIYNNIKIDIKKDMDIKYVIKNNLQLHIFIIIPFYSSIVMKKILDNCVKSIQSKYMFIITDSKPISLNKMIYNNFKKKINKESILYIDSIFPESINNTFDMIKTIYNDDIYNTKISICSSSINIGTISKHIKILRYLKKIEFSKKIQFICEN